MKKQTNEDKYKEGDVKEFYKQNIWKQFWKQKLWELIIIPISALSIWKVPTWVGWGIIKLFNINPATFHWTCKDISTDSIIRVCDGINYSNWDIYLLGLLTLIVILGLTFVNWFYAKERVERKAKEKFGWDRCYAEGVY